MRRRTAACAVAGRSLMMRVSGMAFAVGVLALASSGAPAAESPASQPVAADSRTIDKLIADLGNESWAVREEAMRLLHQIGLPAVPALKEAALGSDPEVKVRAAQILGDIVPTRPEKLAELRALVQEAFTKADYTAAVRLSRGVTLSEKALAADWLWLGHCCQLAGEWGDAVQAYRKVVASIDADIAAGVRKEEAANQPPRAGVINWDGPVPQEGLGGGIPVGPVGPVPLNDHERVKLIQQRSTVMLWIARIQRAELKAPAAAAKTVREALDYLEPSETEKERNLLNHVWDSIARELPPTLHEAGDLPGAIRAWQRVIDLQIRHNWQPRDTMLVDVERIYAHILTLPQGADRPDVPWILPLGDGGEAKLDLDDPRTEDRAYQRGTYSHYAFAPPPGMEFGAVEFACDIEQINPRFGGQFACQVMGGEPPGRPLGLGSIDWTQKQAGREALRKTFTVPPGAGLLHVKVGHPRGEFIVHSVLAKAALRPATQGAPPIAADAWMQLECYPENGRIAWGDTTLANRTAQSGVRPGRDTLRFSAPDRAERIEVPFEIKPGRRYGLFVNLDSPFRWRQLDLELACEHGAQEACMGIQQLAGGGYLAVWCGAASAYGEVSKILAATSKDLVEWSKPAPLPFNSVFGNVAPGTFRDADGTVWLAYFSNRLNVQSTYSTAGYSLWMTSTRDGKVWTPPRKIEIQSIDGSPLDPPCILAGPDGSRWIFCRNFAGSAGTLDRITRLERMELPIVNGNRLNMWNFQVFHDGRQFHMVCDDFGNGIYHLTSTRGTDWAEPRLLVAKAGRTETHYPRLLRAEGAWLLVYAGADAWFIEAVDLAGTPLPAGQGMKISSYLVPLAGATPLVADGKVFFIAGENTAWLLEGDLKDLARVITARK